MFQLKPSRIPASWRLAGVDFVATSPFPKAFILLLQEEWEETCQSALVHPSNRARRNTLDQDSKSEMVFIL